jgi:hypothetical protein
VETAAINWSSGWTITNVNTCPVTNRGLSRDTSGTSLTADDASMISITDDTNISFNQANYQGGTLTYQLW